MKMLLELLMIIEAKKKSTKPSKTMRQKVYHHDYVKTKHKPYRQYDQEEEHKGE